MGSISLGGNIIPVENIAESLQVAVCDFKLGDGAPNVPAD